MTAWKSPFCMTAISPPTSPRFPASCASATRPGRSIWSKPRASSRSTTPPASAGKAASPQPCSIAQGLDVGNVVVEEKAADGNWIDAVYTMDFAFAFKAFYPGVPIVTE